MAYTHTHSTCTQKSVRHFKAPCIRRRCSRRAGWLTIFQLYVLIIGIHYLIVDKAIQFWLAFYHTFIFKWISLIRNCTIKSSPITASEASELYITYKVLSFHMRKRYTCTYMYAIYTYRHRDTHACRVWVPLVHHYSWKNSSFSHKPLTST